MIKGQGRALAELFGAGQIPRIVGAIEGVVDGSFDADGARRTQAEIKRRSELAVDTVCQLRADLQWSVSRICDHLAVFMRARLDGAPWRPDHERSAWWTP